MHATYPLLKVSDFPQLRREGLITLQVNLGYRCNQSCLHCHVNAGPKRKEQMSRETVDVVLRYLETGTATILDITGGAPELNEHFRYLVVEARKLSVHVIDRCNLTILNEPDQYDLAAFLADNQVEVIASMPCYLQENVDAQRGTGVFESSLQGLRKLNSLGYANAETGLQLNLVYNPVGASLPPPQKQLEADYRRELGKHSVSFNHLYTLANMPIQRFGSTLVSKGEFKNYMNLLKQAHQQSNIEHVMCRSLISVDWRGFVYDCDFNQMLDLPLPGESPVRTHLRDLIGVDLYNREIAVADHCYGCTAGQGSSCGGALESST